MTRWRIRSEPVRCTSTLIPGYAASKSLATFSALVSAREVYQTTLPSFLAASPRASWATAGAGAARRARPSRMGATERCRRRTTRIATPLGQRIREQGSGIIQPPHQLSGSGGRRVRARCELGGERFHQGVKAQQRVEAGHGLDDTGSPLVGEGERGIATELRLDLLLAHGQIGAAARAILSLLEHPPVVEADRDMADELTRVVDARIDFVRYT